ncbi:phage holin family protein [Sphingomonas oligophenolica]|uniref:phage holin family protein n=1 Tax=Sphingomonas oligophenolica TaxID=301154 RepID=UPI001F4F5996|nr:phage holin family protein [Sphingomonas oligophenolica]
MLNRGHDSDSVGTLVGQLVEDTRGLAKAEIALAKARLGERVAAYRTAVVFFVVAGTLAFAALIALLVGMILTLATLVGPGYATAIVVVGVLALAGVLGLIGKSKLARPDPETAA